MESSLLRCEKGPLKRTYVLHFFIPLFFPFAVIPAVEEAISTTRQTSASATYCLVYCAMSFVVFPRATKQQLLCQCLYSNAVSKSTALLESIGVTIVLFLL